MTVVQLRHPDDCPACEAMRMRAEAAELDARLAEKALRKERQGSEALRRMVAEAKEKAPEAPQIIDVIEFYAVELGKPKIKVKAVGQRAEAVEKALSWDFTVAELKQAILGLKRKPYLWEITEGRRTYKKRMAFGCKEQRKDDLESALYSLETVERFIGYALEDVPDERMILVPARVLDRCREREASLKHIAASLHEFAREQAAYAQGIEALLGWHGGGQTALPLEHAA